MNKKQVLAKLPLVAWGFALKIMGAALRARLGGGPVVWLSLSGGGPGSAADLRAASVAPELERLGWRSVVLHPRLGLRARRLLLRLFRPDVVLLQQTRHPLNRPEIYAPVPCVLDADDADIINPAERARIGDIAGRCYGVVAGSRHLAELFAAFNPARRVIWTGTYLHQPAQALPNAQRGAVLAWAPSDPFGYPSELAFVQDIAQRLQAPALELRVYGIKPERQAEMTALWQGKLPLGCRLRLMPLMPYPAFVASLAEVAVGLQPVCEDHEYSLGKSFGKALAYLAADTAIVASNNIDHPLFFKDRVNSRLLDNEAAAWAQACNELLADPAHRESLVTQARQDFLTRLTTTRSASLLSDLLHRARAGQAWPRGLAPNSAAHD
jgi:hypothetical protein